MKFASQRIDVTYEGRFRTPWFDLPRVVHTFVGNLYERVNPRFAIPLENIQGLPANTMADAGLRVLMFGGVGEIEVKPGGLLMQFQKLATDQDLMTVMDCARLVSDVVASTSGSASLEPSTIRTLSWIKCEADRDAIERLLDDMNLAKVSVVADALGATKAASHCRREFSHDTERWVVSAEVDRSAVETTDIVYAFRVEFLAGSKLAAFEEQLRFAAMMHIKALGVFGLEASFPPSFL